MTHNPNNTADPTAGQVASPDALTFLRWLYGDDAPGWLTISTFDRQQPTQWFSAHQLDQVATYCQAIAKRYNVYFGLGLREEQIEDGRGESADVQGIPGFWIEIDLKHEVHKKVNLPETIEKTIALVREALPLQPSLIIHSGYGIHVYWLFRELWLFDDNNDRQAAYHLLRRLQATIQGVAKLHGWDVDSTFDLARVLRVPGTYNRKIPADPKLVEMIEADPDQRYNPSDFGQHLIEVDDISYQQTTSEDHAGELLPVELHTLKIPTWLKALIRTGEDVNAAQPYPSRSEALFDAVQGLLKAGIDDQTSMSLLLDSRYAISDKPKEKGQGWLASEIARARAKLNGHQRKASSSEGYHTGTNGEDQQETTPTRPLIQLNTDMTGVVNKLQTAIGQLPKGPYLYQRAHQLSIIARGIKPPKWLRRPPDAPIIHPASPAYIRELAAYAADWEKFDERSQKWKATLPPPWTIDTLIARPSWTFPPLEGIICAPTIRPDGSILATPGYDRDTGLYLAIDQDTFPPISERPTIDDARKALHQLKDVYVDFPFSADHDYAAAVSGLAAATVRKPTVRSPSLDDAWKNQLSREQLFSGKTLMKHPIFSNGCSGDSLPFRHSFWESLGAWPS